MKSIEAAACRTRGLAPLAAALLVACCLVPARARAEEYSLHDLYRVALEQAETVRIAAENINFAVQERRRAIALLLPRLSSFASWTRFAEDKYNPTEINVPGQPPFFQDVLVQPDTAGAWGARAEENLSLSLREITGVMIGSSGIRRTRLDLAAVQQDYLLQVAQAYYLVLMSRKRLDIANSNLDRVSTYRNAASTRLNVGEITETVLLRAESELSSARSDLVKARNALELANASLARLVPLPPGFALAEEPLREVTPEPVASLKATAFSERPDLRSMEEQVKMARQQVSYARGSYWPSLNVSGVYRRDDSDPVPDSLNTESIYASAAVVFPFFEGGLRRAEVQQAKVRQRQAVLSYDNQKKAVALEVERAYLDLMTRKGTLEYLKDQLRFAQDNYRGVMRQFTLGLASSIDVIDANSLLVSSERQLADASYSYQLAMIEVERATGTFVKTVQGGKP
jgi:outer membrane protein